MPLSLALFDWRLVSQFYTTTKTMRSTFIKVKDCAFTAIIHAKFVQAAIMALNAYSLAKVATKVHAQL